MDPRDKKQSETSYVKTFGLTAAIALAGISFHKRTITNRNNILSNIQKSRDKMERFSPSVSYGSRSDIGSDEIPVYEESFKNMPEKYRQYSYSDSWDRRTEYFEDESYTPVNIEEKLSSSGDMLYEELNKMMENDLGIDVSKIRARVEEINDRLLFPKETPISASEKMAGVSGRIESISRKIDNEYPGFKAYLNQIGISYTDPKSKFKIKDMRMTGSSTGGTGAYMIEVTDGMQTKRIHLPMLQSNVARWRGSLYSISNPATLSDGVLTHNKLGQNIMNDLFDSAEFMDGKKLFQVANEIENKINLSLFGGRNLQTVHEIFSLSTNQFIITKYQNMKLGMYQEGSAKAIQELNTIFPRLMETANIKVNKGFVPHGSVRSISEIAALGFRVSSEVPFGLFPGTSYAKPSQARANFMPGRQFGSVHIPKTYIPEKLGAVSEDVIKNLQKTMRTELPGGMTNIMFVKSDAKMRFSGPGSGMFISRRDHVQSNISRYTGVKRAHYDIPLFTTKVVDKELKVSELNKSAMGIIEELETKREVYKKRGTRLGRHGAYQGEKIKNSGNIVGTEVINNHLRVYIDEEINLHEGSKFDQGKLMVSQILESSDIKNIHAGPLEDILRDRASLNLAVDFLTDADSHSKFVGGSMGMGLIDKIIRDVSITNKGQRGLTNKIQSLLTSFIGPDVGELIKEININNKTHEHSIIFKSSDNVITTAHEAFAGLLDLESAMTDALNNNDFRAIRQYQKKADKIFKGYKLISDAEKSTGMDYIPAFVTGIDGSEGSVSMMIARPMMHHETSAYEYTKIGAFKSTRDHYANAYAGKADRYVNYLDSQYHPNVQYIKDKVFATQAKAALGREQINARLKYFKEHTIMNLSDSFKGKNIVKRLASYSYNDQQMKLAGKYRVLNTNVSGLQSVMEEGDYQQMLENGYIDIDDMRNKTKSGLGRFSADVTDKALVDDIIDFMKNAGDDKALYLDLGHEIDINGEKARYLPIHRIDPSDVFELEGKLRVNEHLTDYTQKYYTGSAYHSNIMSLFKRVAEFQTAMADAAKDEAARKQAITAMELSVQQYQQGLKRAAKGKFSTLMTGMFETQMPFSMRSVLNFAPAMKGHGLMATESAALDTVYLQEDDAIALITNGRVKSAKAARSFVDTFNAAKKEMGYLDSYNKIKDMPSTATVSYEELESVNTKLLKMFNSKMIDASGYDKETRELINLTRTSLKGHSKTLKDLKDGMLNKNVDITAEKSKIFDLHNIIRNTMFVEHISKDDDLRRVTGIYQYAVDMLDDLKSGKSTVMGKLVGSPELSPLSMDYLKVAILNEDQKKNLKLVDVSGKKLGKSAARLYVSTETAKKIARDFDFDPIGFLITTFDVMEEKAKTVGAFSLLKDAGLEHLGPGMAGDLSRNMTHESIANVLLGRLFEIKQDSGIDLLDTLRPASMTSVTMGSMLLDIENKKNINIKTLDAKVDEYINSIYSHLPAAEKRKASAAVKNMVLENARGLRGKGLDVSNLRVIENITYGRDQNLTRSDHESKMKTPEHGFLDHLDDTNIRARDLTHQLNKEAFQDYKTSMIERSERFKLIKESTPEAYNLMKAMEDLSFSYSFGERERMFLIDYADKIIAQNTISSKHGTPQVLPKIKNLIERMSNANDVVSNDAVNRLITGNLEIALDKHIEKEMKFLGHKTEGIDMSDYQAYLTEKDAYLKEIYKTHTDTMNEIIGSNELEKLSLKEQAKSYNDLFNTKLANSELLSSKHIDKATGKITGVRKMYMAPRYVYDEIQKNTEAIKAVGKLKTTITDFTKFFTNGTDADTHSLITSIQTSLRLYSQRHGQDIMNDPNVKMFRSFEGLDNFDTAHLIDKYVNDLNRQKTTTKSLEVNTAQHARTAKIAATLSDNTNEVNLHGITAKEKIQRLEKIRRTEIKSIQRDYAERLSNESTIFKSGSIIDSIGGRLSKITASSADDMHLFKASRSMRTNLLTGLFIGTIMGQGMNQIVSGYSVPGLENTVGLGGEHFENKTGLLGNQNEVMMRPRPPRITPVDSIENSLMISNKMLSDIGFIEGSVQPVQRYKSSRQGVYVR